MKDIALFYWLVYFLNVFKIDTFKLFLNISQPHCDLHIENNADVPKLPKPNIIELEIKSSNFHILLFFWGDTLFNV